MVPVILFCGNENVVWCLHGDLYTHEKVLYVCLGDGVKCVGFVYVLF